MNIRIKKNDFFEVLEKYPSVRRSFEENYKKKKNKTDDPNKKIRTVLKEKNSFSAQMVIILDNSKIVEVRVLQSRLFSSNFVKELRKKAI